MSDHDIILPGGLGRLPAPDERDNNFRMSALPLSQAPAKTRRYYQLGPILHQGQTSSCVGHAWRQWLSSAVVMTRTGPDAFTIYNRARQVDEWPGEDYEGTSVRAGAKALQELGHIEAYWWAWDAATVADWLLNDMGVVVAGSMWTRGMARTDKKGFIKPEGASVGGHAWLIAGYDSIRGIFRCANSWGRAWGQNGRFWLAGEHLDYLLQENGEACTATERRLP
jgi:hypothetical protein